LLREGSILTLAIDDIPPAPSEIVPAPLPLDILYEDEHILVCNKAGNMPTHPSHGHYDDTLANAVAHHVHTTKDAAPFVFHPINRLDRNTSGVVLIARHALAASFLHGRKTFRRAGTDKAAAAL
jgi:23S rRNA pseudouridine1911/1915/1917 synthase